MRLAPWFSFTPRLSASSSHSRAPLFLSRASVTTTSSRGADKKLAASPLSPLPNFYEFPAKPQDEKTSTATHEAPLVVVIPWLGCVPYRINERYCRWYSEINAHMIASVPTLSHVLSSATKQKRAKQLIALLKQRQQKESRPIVFHVIGGEAHLIYGHVLRLIQQEHADLYPAIRGAIIDSAPMPFDQDTYLRLLTTWASTYKTTPGGLVTYYSFKAFLNLYLRVSRVQTYVAELNAFLASKQKLPQLYLYGEMDELAPPGLVKKHIEQQVKSGAIVHSQCFDYSAHTKHITVHSDAYWSAVDRFLKTILPRK